MFRKLLVANRGEVAVRVAKTCRRLSISPVAVYSDADRGQPWLEHFDEALCIGPAHPARSYLDQDAILEAARLTEAQALHPGWGFLAENALFAARVRHQGIAWVGPSPRAIRVMGDKVEARRTARALGLPTIPGSEGLVRSAEEAGQLAETIGYPVLLKATAGGGGRGMRAVDSPAEMREAFSSASREAEASFGDAGVYLEKLITSGRHIEFQVVGDSFGDAVTLGERECSVQRRHQKLIEEAPSPVIDTATRAEMSELVSRAVAGFGYEGAGTIEFLRDEGGQLYFMEMNTRLQVEHPVTELITGVDLVEWQLRVAAGEPLPMKQEDIAFDGHAIEARLNAEEVDDDFRPAPGHVESFEIPEELGPGTLRVDTHVKAPCEVPPFYDSLIAKVIAHATTRAEAIETLERALAAARIHGVPTTIPAHRAVLANEEFASGSYDTALMARMREKR